jgi:hypothetical protein
VSKYLDIFRRSLAGLTEDNSDNCDDSSPADASPAPIVAKVAIVKASQSETDAYDPLDELPRHGVDQSPAWHRWYSLLVRHYRERHPTDLAWFLAYGEAVNLWHSKYGAKDDGQHCAGCGGPLTLPIEAMPDGARLHAKDVCLIRYGEKWRGAATSALAAVDVKPRSEMEMSDDEG